MKWFTVSPVWQTLVQYETSEGILHSRTPAEVNHSRRAPRRPRGAPDTAEEPRAAPEAYPLVELREI